MPAHACKRARVAASGGGGRARAQDRVRVRVPYPAWFFLNRVWVASLPLRYPNRTRSAIRI